MRNKTQQSKIAQILQSRIFLFCLLGIAVLVAFSYMRAYYQDYKIRQEIQALEEEVRSLEQKKIESLEILQYVQSDAFVEEKARTELQLKKPGEKVIIYDTPVSESRDDVDESLYTHLTQASNPIKWWYYFTGIRN